MAAWGMLEPASVIVAVDFGTTYSGFSYMHTKFAEGDPDKLLENVEGFLQWPSQNEAGARPYFKTQTSLLYMQTNSDIPDEYELKGWGWSASVQYAQLLQRSKNKPELDGRRFHFITQFKLALAGRKGFGESYEWPRGLTAERAIADYLHELSIVVVKELQNKFGNHISKKLVKWCLTVPATWEDFAKQQMKICAQKAGLVSGPFDVLGEGSPYPIEIVLEPEAASVYCLSYLKNSENITLEARSKILIVDAGGGTVDLVLHEKVNSEADCNQVKEICSGSSGALCGSTFVDTAFYNLLSRKIPCYNQFISENPSTAFKIRKQWEEFKVCFDGETVSEFWLPRPLSKYWEEYSESNGLHGPDSEYDDVKITLEEMTAIFDSAVDTILELIEKQLHQVKGKDVDALLVVGGFSGSPYLMSRIKTKFDGEVKRIINPTHSGKAVVTGAVAYGCPGKQIVTTRISRKTYGVSKFNGTTSSGKLCDQKFDVFVRKGEEVAVDHCVKKLYTPVGWKPESHEARKSWLSSIVKHKRFPGQSSKHGKCLKFGGSLYSTEDTNPSLVTDPGTVLECSYEFPCPVTEEKPVAEISLCFGKTIIEVTAVPVNFESDKIELSITLDSEKTTFEVER